MCFHTCANSLQALKTSTALCFRSKGAHLGLVAVRQSGAFARRLVVLLYPLCNHPVE